MLSPGELQAAGGDPPTTVDSHLAEAFREHDVRERVRRHVEADLEPAAIGPPLDGVPAVSRLVACARPLDPGSRPRSNEHRLVARRPGRKTGEPLVKPLCDA